MSIRRTEIHPVVLVVLGAALAVGLVLTRGERQAHADPKPGLWQEAVTQADGVTVRVIRDTTGGNFNVCYVASRTGDRGMSGSPQPITVAISCVPERKP